MTACRVSVEALHNQHRAGNVFEVHVVLSVPGRDLAASRPPHHAKDGHAKNGQAHPDIHTSVREAFRAAERQLESLKGQSAP